MKGEKKPVVPETDLDALRKASRFVRTEENDGEGASGGNDYRALAMEYEAKLFREFALADLSQYHRHQIGLRWRTARECESGKGERSCGALDCVTSENLSCFELPFTYREGQEKAKMTTLVKLKVCPRCAEKVAFIAKKGGEKNAKKKKKEEEKKRKEENRRRKKKREEERKKDGALLE